MKLFDRTLGKTSLSVLPVIPLRDVVVFPGMVVPVFASRRQILDAAQSAMAIDKMVFLASQKTLSEEPSGEELFTVGCTAQILQMMRLPDQNVRILIEGRERACIASFDQREPFLYAGVKTLRVDDELSPFTLSLMRTVENAFKTYAGLNRKIPQEVLLSVERTAENPNRLIDLICGHVPFKFEKKLELLALEDTVGRLNLLAESLFAEIEVLELQQKISLKVKKRMEKTQKNYFLNEQLKEINRELGKGEPEDASGLAELKEKLAARALPEEALAKANREMSRLEKLQSFSPEAGILRAYIEWLADLPWTERTIDVRDIEKAAAIMDEDHYGLRKPKDRILDFIAVRQLAGSLKGPILCLVGPPGTGKTSLGRSVARCLGRKFVRISLGGVRDEAEIRGHRKTYVGALPGKILQSLRKAGTQNPVFLLDEIDKMASDSRGDPASALLEVLDPEQNSAFMDHYLEIPYDLSAVMFITTANSLHNIPYPLRDRMEVIEIPGYTEYEKLKIAEGFLLPKQIAENGLTWAKINFRKDALREIIHRYTLESGVRGLEREIAQVSRKIAREAVRRGGGPTSSSALPAASGEAGEALPATALGERFSPLRANIPLGEADSENRGTAEALAENEEAPLSGEYSADGEGGGLCREDALPEENALDAGASLRGEGPMREENVLQDFSVTVTARGIARYLGKPRFKKNRLYSETWTGLAYGLAWTEMGGMLLPVEAAVFEGTSGLILTGSLGDVMKESALAAFSYLKSNADRFKLPPDFYQGKDIHIHVAEGAIPKDGPSAGITMTAAMLSALSGVTLHRGFAMTGEITLSGRVLPVGGVKEKVLAAHRSGIGRVLLPKENEDSLEEIPKEVLSSTEFMFAETIFGALKCLFPAALFRGD
ncbi:MAG: endopeptidase La [Spirochaetales bacterium]|jgi:ATP-dependent Lon protease|nr:endopeptidase La [Spirochaetales bacterium]